MTSTPTGTGVDPARPVRGGWFVRNYVLQELAHRLGDELLLWDSWGAMSGDLGGDTEADLALVDEVAALLRGALPTGHGRLIYAHDPCRRISELRLLGHNRAIATSYGMPL